MKKYETPNCDALYALYDGLYWHQPEVGHHGARPENQTRLERALSWLSRSEACGDIKDAYDEEDADEQFIFLWISFNAAYGDDPLKFVGASGESTQNEDDKFTEFLDKVAMHDKKNGNRLTEMIRAHKDKFRELMNDRFLFQSFWEAERDHENEWEELFKDRKKKMREALRDASLDAGSAVKVLELAFKRLYMLRNQIVHGSATYRDDYNRTSLQRGNDVLGLCVPEILKIMLAVIKQKPAMLDWGRVRYPPYLPVPDDTAKGPPRRGKN